MLAHSGQLTRRGRGGKGGVALRQRSMRHRPQAPTRSQVRMTKVVKLDVSISCKIEILHLIDNLNSMVTVTNWSVLNICFANLLLKPKRCLSVI